MKYDLVFAPPIMNTAGSLGFAPDPRGQIDLGRLGAFVTNPVSLRRRDPAQGTRYLPYPGGFLLHTGHPNPGLKSVIKRYRDRWGRAPLPVLVHLLVQDEDETARMVERLEGLAGVIAGLELGLPPWAETDMAVAMTQAAIGELPVVVRLPFERAAELATAIAGAAEAAAFSLGAPRGAQADVDGTVIHGRLYGPGVFPLALGAVQAVQEAGLPVIAAGGVYQPEQIETLLAAGASGVQLDAVLWRGGWGNVAV
jgi:dihydroorotate dehydrogenase (NAD+) catalytic subunit